MIFFDTDFKSFMRRAGRETGGGEDGQNCRGWYPVALIARYLAPEDR